MAEGAEFLVQAWRRVLDVRDSMNDFLFGNRACCLLVFICCAAACALLGCCWLQPWVLQLILIQHCKLLDLQSALSHRNWLACPAGSSRRCGPAARCASCRYTTIGLMFDALSRDPYLVAQMNRTELPRRVHHPIPLIDHAALLLQAEWPCGHQAPGEVQQPAAPIPAPRMLLDEASQPRCSGSRRTSSGPELTCHCECTERAADVCGGDLEDESRRT